MGKITLGLALVLALSIDAAAGEVGSGLAAAAFNRAVAPADAWSRRRAAEGEKRSLADLTASILEKGSLGKAEQFNVVARLFGIPSYLEGEAKIRRVYVPADDGSAQMLTVRRHNRTGRVDLVFMSGSTKTAVYSYLSSTHGRLLGATVRSVDDPTPRHLDLAAASAGYGEATLFWKDWLEDLNRKGLGL